MKDESDCVSVFRDGAEEPNGETFMRLWIALIEQWEKERTGEW